MKRIIPIALFGIACSSSSCSKTVVPEDPHDDNQSDADPTEVVSDEEDGEESSTTGEDVEDQPSAPPEVVVPPVRPVKWTWPLGLDEGLRNDAGGQGWFGAPRGTRKHTGLDLKAPTGTPVLAVCPGDYITGDQRPYGTFARLVCKIPEQELWVSVMYAHLSLVKEVSEFTPVRIGDEIGEVGKSGNASGDNIDPHLHIEMRIWPDEDSAKADTYSLRDKGPEYDWAEFENTLSECTSLNSSIGSRQDHMFDPFYILLCFGNLPPAVSESWSENYQDL